MPIEQQNEHAEEELSAEENPRRKHMQKLLVLFKHGVLEWSNIRLNGQALDSKWSFMFPPAVRGEDGADGDEIAPSTTFLLQYEYHFTLDTCNAT